jgi:hypothetical protein
MVRVDAVNSYPTWAVRLQNARRQGLSYQSKIATITGIHAAA